MRLNVTITWLPACLARVVVSLEDLLAPLFVFTLVMKRYSPPMRGIFFPLGVEATTEPAFETVGNFLSGLFWRSHAKARMLGSNSLFCHGAEQLFLPQREMLPFVGLGTFPRPVPYRNCVLDKKPSNADFRASKFSRYLVNALELGAIQVKQLFLGGFNWQLRFSSLPGFDSIFSEPIANGRICFLYNGGNFCRCHSLDDIHLVKLLFAKHRGTQGFSVVP